MMKQYGKCGLLAGLLLSLSLAEAAPSAPTPCSAPEFRQFDFWLGRWTAYSEDGKKQGTNHLQRVFGDCGIQENWVSGHRAFTGTSFNFYIPERQVWHQTWIDSGGGTLLLEGGFKDGRMQLQGERISKEGGTVLDRITWTPLEDGRVRQHWQASTDNGVTWSEVFDGYYQREKNPGD